MKVLKLSTLALVIVFLTRVQPVKAEVLEPDSVNLMVEASLFFENYKNKIYDLFTLDHGWKMLKTKPDAFIQYKPYRKMEKIIWYMYQDTTGKVSPETKKMLADTILTLYDMAIRYDTADAGNYMVRKAYVLQTWLKKDPKEVIKTYEEALNSGREIDNKSYYMDILGRLYIKNATDSNGYKMKALEIYSKLSEEEPDNALWIKRLESLAEDKNELLDIYKKAWDLDKNNLEKAWKYASFCIRIKNYEKSIEPLEFLIQKSPDVINYWRELAHSYQKIGKIDKSIKAYKKLISLEPDNQDNYVNLAIIYKKIEQLSVARTYLLKAIKINPKWDYPYYILGTIYEQAAHNCKYDFMDKVVYLLAYNKYKKAASLQGTYAPVAAERVSALANSIPSQEDYFFRKLKSGDKIKITGKCFEWIHRTVIVP